jgi:NAD(P)-dependent dehydrogenase (short-subunit alcohol dehydrogenase family)
MTDQAGVERSVASEVRRLADFGSGKLTSHVAIVTGAGMQEAGPIGTGAAISHVFAAHGARVVVLDRMIESGERTCESISRLGGEALFYAGDVTKEMVCSEVVSFAHDTWGRLDVLVNNVGISPQATVEEVSLEAWESAYRTNTTSAMMMIRAASSYFGTDGGSIINISSIAAIRSLGAVSYGASKAALIALTREAAYTLGPRGVRANCILPGQIYAPMSGFLSSDARQKRRLATLLGTEGTAWDIAATALFLASGDARWITGVVIPVDAGTTTVTSLGMEALQAAKPRVLRPPERTMP